MATFNKSTEITAQFDAGDIRSMYLSTGAYSCYMQITTRNDETVKLSFAGNEALHEFVNAVLTMSTKLDWTEKYGSEYCYMDKDNMVTTEQVAEWKRAAETLDSVIEG